MNIINLANPERSEISYKVSKFPDGQLDIVVHSTIKSLSGGRNQFVEDCDGVIIKSRFNDFNDLGLIVATVVALRGLKVKKIELFIPYVSGARSDRKFQYGGTQYLSKVVAPIINSLGFERVTAIDPHSDVMENVIDNFYKEDNNFLVKEAISNILSTYDGTLPADLTFISPDAGAQKKIYDVIIENGITDLLVATKKRNLVTGAILETKVPGVSLDLVPHFFVIVDDICDGGRTFNNIVEAIQEVRYDHRVNDKFFLIVTHGIFSAGFVELNKNFSKIYTTNSVKDLDGLPLIKQSNVFY